MNILHISDLHINNSESEALRSAYYKEYLSGLIDILNGSVVDKIFITGDVVDRFSYENYPHAADVIRFLGGQLSVADKNIFIAQGNHDKARDGSGSDYFNDFLREFDDVKDSVESNSWYSIFQLDESSAVLCLDSIRENFKDGRPSSLETREIDEIVMKVRNLNLQKLFVLSHHPANSYDIQSQAPFDEGADWSKSHIWSCGGNLFRRLSNKHTVNGCVYWFSGDVHRNEYTKIGDSQVLIVTGSCNANLNDNTSINPQARMVFSEPNRESTLIEYSFSGHNKKGLEGCWVSKTIASMNINPPSSGNKFEGEMKAKDFAVNNVRKDEIFDKAPKGLDDELGKEIHKQVVDKALYKFGRFDTCDSKTALSWVSISPLLDSRSIYLGVVNAYKNKISKIIAHSEKRDQCIIIGIDHWGAILAARLGASINVRSCCLAIRGKMGSYDTHEVINDRLRKVVSSKKFVFVLTDVISTGSSMIRTLNELKKNDSNWYGFSIIFDPTQERKESLKCYNEVFYICGSLKMPLINTDMLPQQGLLKSDISFL